MCDVKGPRAVVVSCAILNTLGAWVKYISGEKERERREGRENGEKIGEEVGEKERGGREKVVFLKWSCSCCFQCLRELIEVEKRREMEWLFFLCDSYPTKK